MAASLRGQLARFLVAGLTTVAIDYLSYRLLLALDMPTAAAKGASFAIGTVFAYVANRFWTFGAAGMRAAPGSALRFAGLYAATLLCNVAANALVLAALRGHALAIQAAFLVATAMSASLNFVGMKYLVFKPVLPAAPR